MSAVVVLALLAAMAMGSGSKAPPPRPKPKLPVEPLGLPPAAAAAKPAALVPGSPPAGAVPPGTPPKPTALQTPAQAAAAKKKVAAAKPKAPVSKPLGKVVAKQAAQQKPPAGTPAVGVKASPELEPNHGPLPAGYAPVKARSRARAIAAHLAKKGPAGYSHAELKSWQAQAGLRADGLYGGSSRGALVYFGVKDPPRPFFQPVATLPYVPPEQRR